MFSTRHYFIAIASVCVFAPLSQSAPREPVRDRAEQYAKKGSIDLLLASSTAWEPLATEEHLWAPAFMVGSTVAQKAKFVWPLGDDKSTDFRAFARRFDPTVLKQAAPYREPPAVGINRRDACHRLAVVTPSVMTNRGIRESIILASGPVSCEKATSWSVIFANGDVNCNDDVTKTIIIADGDIRVKRLVTDSLLIARGRIIVAAAFETSIIAGRTVKVELETPAPRDPISKNNITEGEQNPLGILTFFELSRVGLDVAEKDKVVKVAKLTATSPIRKANILVGDTISKVNGLFVTNSEELRRALRDGIATKGEGTLLVVRDGKQIEIRVPFPD